jgi:hypothetical protein
MSKKKVEKSCEACGLYLNGNCPIKPYDEKGCKRWKPKPESKVEESCQGCNYFDIPFGCSKSVCVRKPESKGIEVEIKRDRTGIHIINLKELEYKIIELFEIGETRKFTITENKD